MLLVAAVLVCVNLVAIFVELLVVLDRIDLRVNDNYISVQDIWFPILMAVWIQAVVNGVLLMLWRRSRPAGLGILLGALVAAGLFVLFIAATLGSMGS